MSTLAELYGIKNNYNKQIEKMQYATMDYNSKKLLFMKCIGKKTKEEMIEHIEWLKEQIEKINTNIAYKRLSQKKK